MLASVASVDDRLPSFVKVNVRNLISPKFEFACPLSASPGNSGEIGSNRLFVSSFSVPTVKGCCSIFSDCSHAYYDMLIMTTVVMLITYGSVEKPSQ